MVSMTSLKGTRSLVEKVKQCSLMMLTAMLDSRFIGNAMPSRCSLLLCRNFSLRRVRYSLSLSFRFGLSYFFSLSGKVNSLSKKLLMC